MCQTCAAHEAKEQGGAKHHGSDDGRGCTLFVIIALPKQQVNIYFHAGQEHKKQKSQIAESAQPPSVHGG
ncbi:hypothetical protein Alches_22730 [Alicyclobacillus hesperidum subsp. aegles]|nr:hypothetical protein Alches_22730 [Alicyclobacillus hesperidum subsp. aegles]